jgi:hypothetical protein
VVETSLTLPDGTKVSIRGSTRAVANLVRSISGTGLTSRVGNRRKVLPETKAPKLSLSDHIRGLKQDKFFNRKRTLREIQKKLEEKGQIYALTSLSPALIRLVRARVLGHVMEGGNWKYVAR